MRQVVHSAAAPAINFTFGQQRGDKLLARHSCTQINCFLLRAKLYGACCNFKFAYGVSVSRDALSGCGERECVCTPGLKVGHMPARNQKKFPINQRWERRSCEHQRMQFRHALHESVFRGSLVTPQEHDTYVGPWRAVGDMLSSCAYNIALPCGVISLWVEICLARQIGSHDVLNFDYGWCFRITWTQN